MEQQADDFIRQHKMRNRTAVISLFRQKMEEAFDQSSDEYKTRLPLDKM